MKRIILCFSMVLMIACVSQKSQYSESNTITIGAVGPLSGDSAYYGWQTMYGYILAVEALNAQGGLLGKRINLVQVDDRSDPAYTERAWLELIKTYNAIAIAGSVQSKCSLAGAVISQEFGIPMISPTSTNPQVTKIGDFVFRACFIDPYQGTIGAAFAYKHLKAKTAACLFDRSNPYTATMAEKFREHFTELGGTMVGFEQHEPGITDFARQLETIITANPDVIFVSDYYFDAIPIAKQARELGYTGTFIGGDGWDSPDLVQVGGKALEGSFFINHGCVDNPDPLYQTFSRRFQTRFGKVPDNIALLAYDAMNMLLEAIRKAGSTEGGKIKEQLGTGTFTCASGSIRFDQDRNPIKPAVIITIKNGEQVFYTSIEP